MRVAFLGLGRMGVAMARHVLDAGHELTVWNRTPGKAGPLVDGGRPGGLLGRRRGGRRRGRGAHALRPGQRPRGARRGRPGRTGRAGRRQHDGRSGGGPRVRPALPRGGPALRRRPVAGSTAPGGRGHPRRAGRLRRGRLGRGRAAAAAVGRPGEGPPGRRRRRRQRAQAGRQPGHRRAGGRARRDAGARDRSWGWSAGRCWTCWAPARTAGPSARSGRWSRPATTPGRRSAWTCWPRTWTSRSARPGTPSWRSPARCCSEAREALDAGHSGEDYAALIADGPADRRGRRSAPDVPVAGDDVGGAGQLGQAHRPAGVQLLGRDADLGAEAELAAVGEPRATR